MLRGLGRADRPGRHHLQQRAVGTDHLDARAFGKLRAFHPPNRVAGLDAASAVDDRIDEIEGLADQLHRALIEQRPLALERMLAQIFRREQSGERSRTWRPPGSVWLDVLG